MSQQDSGLPTARAKELFAKFGPNELPEKRENPVLRFLKYLWGPIPWMIEVAAGLAVVNQSWDDFAVIMVLLIVNAVVGFWEEHQAGNAISALRQKLAVEARVLRDGKWVLIPSRELVPGDLVRLRAGDVVPADVVLSPPGVLEVDQSTLTGESLPVTRDAGKTVYSSSIVTRGEAGGVVTATGSRTFFGHTAELVETAHTVSHFQRAVLKIGDYLIVTAILLAIVIEAASLIRGESLVTTLQFVLVLTVASIPVAMPTVLSVTMAVGARKLAHKQAVVTRLSAMEELAGMDVLCSDKTGTLTQNRLTMGTPFTALNVIESDLLQCAALASKADNQDAIDLAILAKVPPGSLSGTTVLEFRPFDPKTKRTEATVRDLDGRSYAVTKGACQVIFELTRLAGEEKARADREISECASRGFRTLGVARGGGSGPWEFLGVLPLFDPLRPDSKTVVAEARGMGIDVKMLTGDQLAIGQETARQLGLGTNFLPAESIRGPAGGGAAATAAVEGADGFAQVFPEDKFVIVERLQAEGHIVGMTGDGVNDAPALKKADVGVAVSGATDVARGSASIVLLSAGLQVLVDAVAESRMIFERMTTYAIYRIGETLRILLLLSLSILILELYPVTAIMIVLLAVMNDAAILSIAYDNAEVARSPVRWDMRTVLTVATVLGVVGVSFSFLLLFLALKVWLLPFAVVQTMIYLKLSTAGHLGIFATRTKGPFWKSRPAAILVLAVIGTQALATIIAVGGFILTPVPLEWVGVVWGFSALDLIVFDLSKQVAYRWLGRSRPELRPKPAQRTAPPSPIRSTFYSRRFASPSSHRKLV